MCEFMMILSYRLSTQKKKTSEFDGSAINEGLVKGKIRFRG